MDFTISYGLISQIQSGYDTESEYQAILAVKFTNMRKETKKTGAHSILP